MQTGQTIPRFAGEVDDFGGDISRLGNLTNGLTYIVFIMTRWIRDWYVHQAWKILKIPIYLKCLQMHRLGQRFQ